MRCLQSVSCHSFFFLSLVLLLFPPLSARSDALQCAINAYRRASLSMKPFLLRLLGPVGPHSLLGVQVIHLLQTLRDFSPAI